jgi:DNA-binding transcriptional regulator LsrR (DeoR family)
MVSTPSGTGFGTDKEIERGVNLFRRIVKDNAGIDDLLATDFAKYTPQKLRHLLKMALFSRTIQLCDVERDELLEKQIHQSWKVSALVANTSFPTGAVIDETIRTEVVAFLAAQNISSLPYQCSLGLTGGSTIGRFVDLLPPASPNLSGIKWVSLLTTPQKSAANPLAANSIIERAVYSQPGAIGFKLPFVDVPYRHSKEAQHFLNPARHVEVAFLSVGSPEYNYTMSDTHQGSSDLTDVLEAMAPEHRGCCVGDVLLSLIDSHGQRVGSSKDIDDNDAAVFSIGLDGLQQIVRSHGTVWILAARQGKADVVRGAITAKLANALILDQSVATAMLQ